MLVPALENLEALAAAKELSEKGFPVAFDFAAFELTRDKLRSKALFEKIGGPHPLPHPAAGFPLIAKPSDKSGSEGVRLLETEAELKDYLAGLGAAGAGGAGGSGGAVLEECLTGPSYSVEIVGSPGKYKTYDITLLEMDSVYDCRAGWSPWPLSPEKEAGFREMAVKCAEALGLRGIMDAEVIDSPSGLKLLEIDARLPSQTPLAVYFSSGVNLLRELAAVFAPVPPEEEPPKPAFSLLEHVLTRGGQMALTGEHSVAAGGPLAIREKYYGTALSLTPLYRGGPNCATVIFRAESFGELRRQRQESYRGLEKRLRAKAPPEVFW